MKNKLLFLLIFLLLIPKPQPALASYGETETTIVTDYDGHINDAYTNNTSGNDVQAGNNGANVYRGWFSFQIDGIPDSAVIVNVSLLYHGHTNVSNCSLTEMDVNASTVTGADLYNYAGNGTVIYNTTGFPVAGASQTAELGVNRDSFCKDFETILASGQDWYSIGLKKSNESAADGSLNAIYSSDYGSANPEPSLYVEYYVSPHIYVFSDTYYENGTAADPVTVTVEGSGFTDSFNNSGGKTQYYNATPETASWDIGDGYTRYINMLSVDENFTITVPDDTDALYSFTIKDYSNRIGTMDAWLEAYRMINGTETLITRQKIYDQVNPVPLNLVQGKTYIMKARFSDGYLHEFGYYTATTDTTHTYSIVIYEWTDRAQTVYNDVTAEATRPNATHIQLVYVEEIPGYDTLSANMTILFKSNGTQATKVTSSGESSTTLHWYSVGNETDYVVILNAEVEHYGDIQMSWVLDYTRSYNPFPQLDAFGDWGGLPVGDVMAIFSSLIVMGCFSFVSRKAAPFMAVGMLAIFTHLGSTSFTTLQLGVGFSLSLIYALAMGAES